MKTILLTLSIFLVASVNFIVYCCMIMAGREDEILEQLDKDEK